MKIAVISDIHSNPKALSRVLGDLKAKMCRKIICLGDIVGYGYDPNGCIEMLDKFSESNLVEIVCVLGNHDAALCGKLPISWFSETAAAGVLRQQKILRNDYREWLDTLPYTERNTRGKINLFYAHGSYVPQASFYGVGDEMFPYVTGSFIAKSNFDAMKKFGPRGVLFIGHTHERGMFSVNGRYSVKNYGSFAKHCSGFVEPKDDGEIDVSQGMHIVNVGSVGYPRVNPFTSYVIYDSVKHTIRYRTLKFNFREYVEEMLRLNIPIPRWMDNWCDGKHYYDEEGYEKEV